LLASFYPKDISNSGSGESVAEDETKEVEADASQEKNRFGSKPEKCLIRDEHPCVVFGVCIPGYQGFDSLKQLGMEKFSMIQTLRTLQSALQRRLDQLQSQGLREVLAIPAKRC